MTGPFELIGAWIHLLASGLLLVTGQSQQAHTEAGYRAGVGEPRMLSGVLRSQSRPHTVGLTLPSQDPAISCLIRQTLPSSSPPSPGEPPTYFRDYLFLQDLIVI